MRTPTQIRYFAAVMPTGLFLASCNKDSHAPKPLTPTTAAEEMVITPAGLMAKSKVHFVEPVPNCVSWMAGSRK